MKIEPDSESVGQSYDHCDSVSESAPHSSRFNQSHNQLRSLPRMKKNMNEIKDIWKQFEHVHPGHRALHHLMAVYHLTREYGFATSSDIVNFLNISKASVSGALRGLKKAGFVVVDQRQRYRLSGSGVEIVNTVLAKRHIVMQFLTEILGLPPLDAMADACKIEHLLSQQAADRLTTLVGLLRGGSSCSKEFWSQLQETTKFCQPDQHCDGCPAQCCFAVRNLELETVDNQNTTDPEIYLNKKTT